ncbi:myb-related transcription factor, partner of profilin-like [Conger conger]|uniref:myb-related transcription factor, partner of profilin-like n=1 Tax=Conger conger TaxID=82655 RepID=UPI002A5A9831|nr:myb-related transcription factor, partner of profilin-like [Conger conger]
MDAWVVGARARLRKPKFTPDQVRVLMERVVARRTQLYGQNISQVSVRKRIWQEVTQAVNRISHTQRSVSEVQKRWQDERRRIRHRAHDLWRALAETGVPMGHLSPLEEAVLSTLDEPLEAGPGTGVGLGAAPPPQPAVPQQCLQEDLPAPQQQCPAPARPTSMPVVCLQDIKLEPESASPSGGGSEPQDWKFEWTVEEVSGASLQPNSAPSSPEVPPPIPQQPPPDTMALHASAANQTRPGVRSACSVARGRSLRRRRRQGLDRASCAGLTACLRRAASGTAGLRHELRSLSDNVLGLRAELRALVGAVSAIATALQGRHGDQSAERRSATPPRQ